MDIRWIVLVFLLLSLIYLLYDRYTRILTKKEGMEGRDDYVQSFKEKENRMFPFRYFTDDAGNALPFVAITGFFRGKDAEDRYHEYVKNGIHLFGITAYKSFPNRELMDKSEGEYERNDTFDYTGKIKDWLCCFQNKENYGFSDWNRTMDISESDFYNAEESKTEVTKKYDFIYICNKDSDSCPLDGWNAINRNFDLAKKCFPIMCNEFGLKGLVVGREGCGLEKEYGDKLEVTGWFDWHVLQEKMRESKFLFVPNIFDASPRVIAECITKGLAVLMNRHILCGSKYVTYETGELFSDENDLRPALTNLLNKQYKLSPKNWWKENYSQERSQRALRDFLESSFPGELDNVSRVQFIL